MSVYAQRKVDKSTGKEIVTGWRAVDRPPRMKSNSKVFKRKDDADAWLSEQIARRVGGARFVLQDARATTVADLIGRYSIEVAPAMRSWKYESIRLARLAEEPFAKLNLTDDIPEGLRTWRDHRLNGTGGYTKVKGETINRDLNALGPIFELAAKEWGARFPQGNPAQLIARCKEKTGWHRDKTWSESDIETYLAHLKFNENANPEPTPENGLRRNAVSGYYGWAVLLCLYVGQRLSNIIECQIGWIDLEAAHIRYPVGEVKNGKAFNCPLRPKARELLAKLLKHRLAALDMTFAQAKEVGATLFPGSAASFSVGLREQRELLAKTHPHFKELTTHDLRHNFMTDFIRKTNHPTAKTLELTGRESVKHMMRYYNPSDSERVADMDF